MVGRPRRPTWERTRLSRDHYQAQVDRATRPYEQFIALAAWLFAAARRRGDLHHVTETIKT